MITNPSICIYQLNLKTTPEIGGINSIPQGVIVDGATAHAIDYRQEIPEPITVNLTDEEWSALQVVFLMIGIRLSTTPAQP